MHSDLTSSGYDNIPNLPAKKIGLLMNENDKNERQAQLEYFLRELVNRKETRNSIHLIDFLGLDKFCPEIIYSVPQLLVRKELPRNKQVVNRCLFIPEHNIYVISIMEKSAKVSRFEIYSFRQTGLI